MLDEVVRKNLFYERVRFGGKYPRLPFPSVLVLLPNALLIRELIMLHLTQERPPDSQRAASNAGGSRAPDLGHAHR